MCPNHIKISPKLIDSLLKEKRLKSYAVFLYMKYKYSNGCYYTNGTRTYALSKRSGLSRKQIDRYFSFFLKQGWMRFEVGKTGTNICFRKHYGIEFNGIIAKQTIKVNISEYTVKGILNALYAFVLDNASRRRQFAINTKLEGQTNNTPTTGEMPPNMDITIKSCARLFNTSERNANRIVLELQRKEKYFHREKCWALVHDWVSKNFFLNLKKKEGLSPVFFWWRHAVYEALPMTWTWLRPLRVRACNYGT